MASSKIVIDGKNLAPKNNKFRSDPYCVLNILNPAGEKMYKAKKTGVIKNDLNPSWKETFKFPGDQAFSGIQIMVWDKHKWTKDKFMGLVTIKLNTEKSANIDDWFALSRRPGRNKERVSGRVHLKIKYGSKSGKTDAADESSEKDSKVDDSEEATVTKALKVSSKWNEKDKQLKKSEYVVIQEDKGQASEEELNQSFKARRGPATPSMATKVGNVKCKKTLEVEHTSGTAGIAKCDVSVVASNWFYEATVLNSRGTIKLGWATQNFSKETDDYGFFITNRCKKSIKGRESDFLEGNVAGWSTNDTITIALDLVNRVITVWRNGDKLGVLFDSPEISRKIVLSPCVVLRGASVRLNFGQHAFNYEPEGYNPLLQLLDKKGKDKLEKLYLKYKSIGMEDEEEDEDEDWDDAIVGTGTIQFSQDVGIDPEEDPSLLVIAWKLNCTSLWSFTKSEWMTGWSIHGCSTLDQMKQKTKTWNDLLLKDKSAFKLFYKFVFTYLKEEKTILSIEESVMVWEMLFRKYKISWKLLEKWCKFLNQYGEFVRNDVWVLLLDFMDEYPENLNNYDPLASWPTLIDEFVEWIQDGCPEKEEEKKDEEE